MAERNTALVHVLLDEGVDVNTARADGATTLLWATHWDDGEATVLLLRAGANVNAADDHGVTPLARACENASASMVNRLLEAGADPNAAQTNGLTPLMTAARTGNPDVVKGLLARGAKVNAATAITHETALMWAVAERRLDIVRALVDKGADVHPRPQQVFSPLIAAAKNGDIETAKVLLAAGGRVNDTGSDGAHPLAYAIVVGQSAFARFLLEQGADPNGAIDGVTALHAASGPVDIWIKAWNRRHGGALRGRLTLDERLGPGERASRQRRRSERAHDRVWDGGTRVRPERRVRYVRDWHRRCGGATPLWVAAYATNPGPGRQRNRGRMPANSTAEILRSLLAAAGARPDSTSHDGTTTLMAAGAMDIGQTPPRAYRQPTAEEAVRLLIDAGVDVNATNEGDFAALHCAAFTGLPELVEYLVEHGADIDARDWRGRTPFRLAEGAKQSFHYQEWPEVAALLQELGADTSLGIPGTIQERLRGLAATQ